MKNRFRLFRRDRQFYPHDNETGRLTSLRTSDPKEARRLLAARNDSMQAPLLNLSLARAYLAAHDPVMASRPWRAVMDQSTQHGRTTTRERYPRAAHDRPFDSNNGNGDATYEVFPPGASDNGMIPANQIVFAGERFDVMQVGR